MVFYPNHTLTIYRNRRIGSTNRFSMSATFTPYQGDIQPGSPTRQQLFPERWGAVYTAFVDVSDNIQEGDEIHTEDGKVYSVRGVSSWQDPYMTDLDHLELTLTSEN